MKLTIDTEKKTLIKEHDGKREVVELYTKKSFELISREWLKVGWNQKHIYTFTWMGRPIIQLPEDMIRIQEVIYRAKPDVIVETGIAHGGGLVFYASLCKAMGNGRVIGVDIEIRPHNRAALEKHELLPMITMIEGSSTDPEIVERVKSLIKPDETVMVILDSNHTKQHVLGELNAYSSLVKKGSYIVATDGSMRDLFDTPRGKPEWKDDNPTSAAIEFASKNRSFVIEQPKWLFCESELDKAITHWPDAFLKRVR